MLSFINLGVFGVLSPNYAAPLRWIHSIINCTFNFIIVIFVFILFVGSAISDNILSYPLRSSLLLFISFFFFWISILPSLLVPLLLLREQVNCRLIDLVTVKRVAEHYHLKTHATELDNVTNLDLIALHTLLDLEGLPCWWNWKCHYWGIWLCAMPSSRVVTALLHSRRRWAYGTAKSSL